jgi:uncharacterized protein (DUF433 family)
VTKPAIVSSPDVQFGAPRIEGTRVDVATVVGRFKAGESVMQLAYDLDLTQKQVQDAIRWELKRRKM